MLNIYKYFKYMEKNDILLLFKGGVSSDLLTSILQITESKLERMNERPKIRKRVFNVLVECLQNVYLHMDNQKDAGTAMLILGKKDDKYFIITANHIKKKKAKELRTRIDNLNALSRKELQDLYNQVLTNEEISDKGGAGLGLIDIIRKSKSKVEYQFEDINNTYTFFSLRVNISD